MNASTSNDSIRQQQIENDKQIALVLSDYLNDEHDDDDGDDGESSSSNSSSSNSSNKSSNDALRKRDEDYAHQLQAYEVAQSRTSVNGDPIASNHYLLTRIPKFVAIYSFVKYAVTIVVLLVRAEGINEDFHHHVIDDKNALDVCTSCIVTAVAQSTKLYEFTSCNELYPGLVSTHGTHSVMINEFGVGSFTVGSPSRLKLTTQLYVIPTLIILSVFTCYSVLLKQSTDEQQDNRRRRYHHVIGFLRQMQVMHFFMTLFTVGFTVSIYYVYIDEDKCLVSITTANVVTSFAGFFYLSFGLLLLWRVGHVLTQSLEGSCSSWNIRTPLDVILMLSGVCVFVCYAFAISFSISYDSQGGSSAYIATCMFITLLTLIDTPMFIALIRRYFASANEQQWSCLYSYPMCCGKRVQPSQEAIDD